MTDLDWNLLAKYVSHECGQDELRYIQDWSEDKKNRQLLDESIRIYNSLNFKNIDLKKSMNNLTDRINKDRLL